MMGEAQKEEVVIVGGGISGLATALALKRVGIRSLVLETADGLRATGAALGLLPNAWRALHALGVADKLIPNYKAFQSGRGHVTNLVNGVTQNFSFNGTGSRGDFGALGVHRKALLEALAEELPPGTIRFSSKVLSIKGEVLKDFSSITVLHLDDGSIIETKILIGCDGVHSVVAQWLGLSPPVKSGWSAVRGLATFPGGHGFGGDIQQFIRDDKRVAMFPLNDTDIYWFITHLSTSNEKEIARDPELIRKEVIENLGKDFPLEFLTVVRSSSATSLTWAQLLLRRPWNVILGSTYKGNVVVAGDAMHPMTPELAQGGCSSLEDAVVLARCIWSNKDSREAGIEQYVRERQWRVSGLIAGAYLTGWVQLGSTGRWSWAVKWFRDNIFYRFIFPRIFDAINYDCGTLPTVV